MKVKTSKRNRRGPSYKHCNLSAASKRILRNFWR